VQDEQKDTAPLIGRLHLGHDRLVKDALVIPARTRNLAQETGQGVLPDQPPVDVASIRLKGQQAKIAQPKGKGVIAVDAHTAGTPAVLSLVLFVGDTPERKEVPHRPHRRVIF
jgi:hypothetical protein